MAIDERKLVKGARVQVRGGKTGSVVYVRCSPPDFEKVAAVSVLLDERRDRPGYAGTLYTFGDILAVSEKTAKVD